MNLIGGLVSEKCSGIEGLELMLLQTLAKDRLKTEVVLLACETLSGLINEEDHLPVLMKMGMDKDRAVSELAQAKRMLSKEFLEEKLNWELGIWQEQGNLQNLEKTPITGEIRHKLILPGDEHPVKLKMIPLGVLFHVAAGNRDGLAVFSVIEGLLTGNINMLKLSGQGDDLSFVIILELIRIQPLLSEYIYVFDCSSEEIKMIERLADLSDGIVIWGGDEAVSAVRKLAKPNTKIIDWGHKLSFSYVTKLGGQEDLRKLAAQICDSNQLLCSSCQGIYLDTEDWQDLKDFSRMFSRILEEESTKKPQSLSMEVQGQITLMLKTLSLDQLVSVTRADSSSVTAYRDSNLVSSLQYRNVWVKRLPANHIIPVLRHHKNHLQTVSLICGEEERGCLTERFFKAGAVCITRAEEGQAVESGMPHDGEYPLLRYIKFVTCR